MGRRIVALALASLAALLCGCTPAEGYELVRAAGEAKAQCERELTVAAAHACEAAFDTDYETYRARRRGVLRDDPGDRPPARDKPPATAHH